MDTGLKASVWDQFGAALDTLEDALNLCPDALWTMVLWKDKDDARYGHFWFIAYHTLFWTDLYISGDDFKGFKPPPPFVRGRLPDNPYTKEQIHTYLDQCRRKCREAILGLTDETANRVMRFEWIEASYLEMQLYSMRHIQEHAAQLNLALGQQDIEGQDWILKARDKAIP